MCLMPKLTYLGKKHFFSWWLETLKPETQIKGNYAFPRSCFASYLFQHHISSTTEVQIQIMAYILWISETRAAIRGRDMWLRWGGLPWTTILERPWACKQKWNQHMWVSAVTELTNYLSFFVLFGNKYGSLFPIAHTNDVGKKRWLIVSNRLRLFGKQLWQWNVKISLDTQTLTMNIISANIFAHFYVTGLYLVVGTNKMRKTHPLWGIIPSGGEVTGQIRYLNALC